jgi:hypothetical protein
MLLHTGRTTGPVSLKEGLVREISRGPLSQLQQRIPTGLELPRSAFSRLEQNRFMQRRTEKEYACTPVVSNRENCGNEEFLKLRGLRGEPWLMR